MSYMIKRERTGPSGYVQFVFDDVITSYLLGIVSFSMSFGDEDHWISRVSLKITPVAPLGPKIVAAEVKMVLQDASGHEITPDSSVLVGCLATTGSRILRGLPGIKDGESVPLVYPAQPILSGFDLEVADTRVKSMRFGGTYEPPLEPIIGVDPPGRGAVQGFSRLGTGDAVAPGTVDCGFVPLDDPNLLVQHAEKVQLPPGQYSAFHFDQPIVDGIVLLQNVSVAFTEPHNVQGLEVTMTQNHHYEEIRYAGACAYLYDTSGSSMTDDSYVSLVAIGIPG